MKIDLSQREIEAIACGFDLYITDRYSPRDSEYVFLQRLNQKLEYLAENGARE